MLGLESVWILEANDDEAYKSHRNWYGQDLYSMYKGRLFVGISVG